MDAREYQPFGEEWKKEMKKWNKDLLIDLLRKTLVENQAYAAQMPSVPSYNEIEEMIKDENWTDARFGNKWKEYMINNHSHETLLDLALMNGRRLTVLRRWLKSLQQEKEVCKYSDGKDYSHLKPNSDQYPGHERCVNCGEDNNVTITDDVDICHDCGHVEGCSEHPPQEGEKKVCKTCGGIGRIGLYACPECNPKGRKKVGTLDNI